MRTYYVDDYPTGIGEPVKAESIENLRKNLIQRYGKSVSLYVSEPKGVQYTASRPIYLKKSIGFLYYHENEAWRYDAAPSGYYWKYGNRTKRVSPKTGKLLDVNREWGYLRCRTS